MSAYIESDMTSQYKNYLVVPHRKADDDGDDFDFDDDAQVPNEMTEVSVGKIPVKSLYASNLSSSKHYERAYDRDSIRNTRSDVN